MITMMIACKQLQVFESPMPCQSLAPIPRASLFISTPSSSKDVFQPLHTYLKPKAHMSHVT